MVYILIHFHRTLREIYIEVKDDIEKLYIRVPTHLRMDIPLPPQALHPSASSSGGIFLIIFESICSLILLNFSHVYSKVVFF